MVGTSQCLQDPRLPFSTCPRGSDMLDTHPESQLARIALSDYRDPHMRDAFLPLSNVYRKNHLRLAIC